MNCSELKTFLKYLRRNKVIEEYERLFDRSFNFDSLLNLTKKDCLNVMSEKEIAVVRLYEVINKIKIDERILDIFVSSDLETKKYIIRIAISDLNEDLKLRIVESLNMADNPNSARYAYSLTTKEKLKGDDNLAEYVRLVSKSKEEVAYRMRDLLVESDMYDNKNMFAFLNILKEVDEDYIADYLIRLYEHKNCDDFPIEKFVVVSLSSTEKQAEYTYELLTDERFKGRKDLLSISLCIATADTEIQSYNALVRAISNYDDENLFSEVLKEVNTKVNDFEESTFNEALKSRKIDDIIFALSSISENIEIDGSTKVKVKS